MAACTQLNSSTEIRVTSFREFSRLVDSMGGVSGGDMGRVALLHGYFDESGKWADKDTISFCGWISQANTWEQFAKEWSELLEELDMSSLHTAEFVSRDSRDTGSILLRFVAIIRKYANSGLGIGVDTKHYRTMSPAFRARVKNPHFIAFKILMNTVLREVQAVQRLFPIHDWRCGIICDQDPGTSEHCLKHFNKMRTFDPVARKLLNGVCFADATGAIPLQAADLLAYAMRIELDRRRTNSSPNPSALFQGLSFRPDEMSGDPVPFFRPFFLDADFLDQLSEGKHDQLLAKLGIEI